MQRNKQVGRKKEICKVRESERQKETQCVGRERNRQVGRKKEIGKVRESDRQKERDWLSEGHRQFDRQAQINVKIESLRGVNHDRVGVEHFRVCESVG